jgi:cystathionine beta-lyase/cystathionine gamma-synthase
MKHNNKLSTHCIHGGEMPDAHGSPQTPLYRSTTFRFSSTADLLDVIEGRRTGSFYTRYGSNPTIGTVEAKLAGLEGAESALAFASGMAAISALCLAVGRPGILCIGEAYGGTLELLGTQLPLLGIATHFLPATEIDRMDSLLAGGVRLVLFETPANPTLSILDIADIAARAHRHGALVAVDNTFATPVNQNPLALGADVAMHSATKYLGGHSDLTAGALMSTRAILDDVSPWRKNLGQMIAPDTAAMLARSLHTLVVRVRQHNANAQAVAEAMQSHPAVARVLYPGLNDFPGHALAGRQMRGYGGMLSIELRGGRAEATSVADRLKLFALAASLGGTESLVSQPCATSHHDMAPAERQRRGITDSMLRLSVGLEDAADLIADLNQALEGCAHSP